MHNHSHTHPHYRHHHHQPSRHRVLLLAIGLIVAFASIEALGGWYTGSLTLLGDAGHMFSDGMALGIAAFAAWIATRPPSLKHSYGFGRAEILAAGLSSLLMLLLSLVVIIKAIERLHVPHPVSGGPVIIIALIGLLLNCFLAWLLARGERTLNIRAALLHIMSDILGSMAALIAGAVIYFTGWLMIDSILSIVIGILIMISTLTLLRESLLILMEGVPGHIDLKIVSRKLCEVVGVKALHDLHIWTLSSGKVALSAHIHIHELSSWKNILNELRQLLKTEYDIEHVTLQPEPEIIDCQPCLDLEP